MLWTHMLRKDFLLPGTFLQKNLQILMFSTGFTSLIVLPLFPLSITFFVFCMVFDSHLSNMMRFSRSTHLQVCLSLETLTSIIRNGLPILVELMDLVNPVIMSQMTLWSFFLCISTVTFPPFGNSDHVVVSVSIDFPSYSKRDAPFHRIAYDFSCWLGRS